MTRKDFMIRLRKTLQKHGDQATLWIFNGANVRMYVEGMRYCPITYLCFREMDQVYHTTQWQSAADILKLRRSTARQIFDAADDRTRKSVRLELLLACALPQDTRIHRP